MKANSKKKKRWKKLKKKRGWLILNIVIQTIDSGRHDDLHICLRHIPAGIARWEWICWITYEVQYLIIQMNLNGSEEMEKWKTIHVYKNFHYVAKNIYFLLIFTLRFGSTQCRTNFIYHKEKYILQICIERKCQ